MLGRRTFLKLAPFIGIGAKTAADEAVAKLADVHLGAGGLTQGFASSAPAPPTFQINQGFDEAAATKAAMRIPALRDELTSILFEDFRHVRVIEPDIAVHRSFSLNAKIAFQRQRFVERELQSRLGGLNRHSHIRIQSLLRKVLNLWPV